MKEIFQEYGSMLLAIAGSFALLALYQNILLAPEGLLARMLGFWGMGSF